MTEILPEKFSETANKAFKAFNHEVFANVLNMVAEKEGTTPDIMLDTMEFHMDVSARTRPYLPGEKQKHNIINCKGESCDKDRCETCFASKEFMKLFPRLVYRLEFMLEDRQPYLFFFDVGLGVLLHFNIVFMPPKVSVCRIFEGPEEIVHVIAQTVLKKASFVDEEGNGIDPIKVRVPMEGPGGQNLN
jgi:hypothetical protein